MDNTRYGIFLRPDPTTCWTITQITTALRAQFGLVSSGAFPPHATIVGNLATTSSAEQVVEAVDPIFRKVPSIAVFNSGVVRQGGCYEFNVNLDDSGQQPNTELGQVANAVLSAVLPLSTRVDDAYSTAVEDYTFAGHLGLAGHDLKVDGHLSDEVGEFIAGLPFAAPPSFLARWYSLFELHADDWTEQWWHTLRWRHLNSWRTDQPSTP